MSESTRAEALKKMERFAVKIGFPEKWIDYSSLGTRVLKLLIPPHASSLSMSVCRGISRFAYPKPALLEEVRLRARAEPHECPDRPHALVHDPADW